MSAFYPFRGGDRPKQTMSAFLTVFLYESFPKVFCWNTLVYSDGACLAVYWCLGGQLSNAWWTESKIDDLGRRKSCRQFWIEMPNTACVDWCSVNWVTCGLEGRSLAGNQLWGEIKAGDLLPAGRTIGTANPPIPTPPPWQLVTSAFICPTIARITWPPKTSDPTSFYRRPKSVEHEIPKNVTLWIHYCSHLDFWRLPLANDKINQTHPTATYPHLRSNNCKFEWF